MGRMLDEPLVVSDKPLEGKARIEIARIFHGSAKKNLRVASLLAKIGQRCVAGRNAGSNQLLVGHSALGRRQRCYGRFRHAHLRIQSRKMHKRRAYQHADRGNQRDQKDTSENESLIKAQHER